MTKNKRRRLKTRRKRWARKGETFVERVERRLALYAATHPIDSAAVQLAVLANAHGGRPDGVYAPSDGWVFPRWDRDGKGHIK